MLPEHSRYSRANYEEAKRVLADIGIPENDLIRLLALALVSLWEVVEQDPVRSLPGSRAELIEIIYLEQSGSKAQRWIFVPLPKSTLFSSSSWTPSAPLRA
jgi:hypothetical protein